MKRLIPVLLLFMAGCEMSAVTNYSRCMAFADELHGEPSRIEFAKTCAGLIEHKSSPTEEP